MAQVSGVFRKERMRPFLAAFCAVGWSLAYPLIKVGYAELGITQNDLGGKILFAVNISHKPSPSPKGPFVMFRKVSFL